MRRRLDRADRLPIFEATRAATLLDPFGPLPPSPRPRHLLEEDRMGRHHDENADGVADQDAPALTAGEQDHSDPWIYAGQDCDPPIDPEDTDGMA